MYTIMMDGKILYSPIMIGKFYKVLNPKLSLDVDTSGSFSFVIPPSNHMHGAIKRRKSIVTVHQHNRMIFMGRVLDSETDAYNQIDVYCEGVRSYLNDSQAAPYTYTGTPRGLLAKLISEHNEQIEPEKQFILGDVTIDQADESMVCENVAYWQTYKEIEEKLLSAYGGYLSARIRGGSIYLDWLKDYGRTPSQKIRFAVNLLDLKNKGESGQMFTILRPLGASQINDEGEYNPPVNIASVNGGLDYIQDDEAVAEYGKIWHTQTWPYIEDPAVLLAKGREYMKIGAEVSTLTLKAIDMHFLDGSIEDIRIGDKVHILSQPHGIDMEKTCCKIEIDLVNPEETIYTFGGPPKALTDNIVKRDTELETLTGYGGGGRKVKQENNGIIRWAEAKINAANANILFTAGEVNSIKNTMSQAWIEIDGLAAAIKLKASQEEVNDLGTRMNQAEIDINGLDAEILLKADTKTVDALGERMTSAEIEIDGANADILLKADTKTVDALGERMTSAEIEIDGANADILLKASQSSVDDLGTRMSQAEIDIDGANSAILLKADKIDLDGYVTADQLVTEFSNFESGITDDLYVSALSADKFECSDFVFKTNSMSLKSTDYVKSVGRTKRYVKSPSDVTIEIWEISSISSGELYYMSWE